MFNGGERTGTAEAGGGVGTCGVADCLANRAARALGPNNELKDGCWVGVGVGGAATGVGGIYACGV